MSWTNRALGLGCFDDLDGYSSNLLTFVWQTFTDLAQFISIWLTEQKPRWVVSHENESEYMLSKAFSSGMYLHHARELGTKTYSSRRTSDPFFISKLISGNTLRMILWFLLQRLSFSSNFRLLFINKSLRLLEKNHSTASIHVNANPVYGNTWKTRMPLLIFSDFLPLDIWRAPPGRRCSAARSLTRISELARCAFLSNGIGMSRIEGSLARQAFATSEYLNVHSAFFFGFQLQDFVVLLLWKEMGHVTSHFSRTARTVSPSGPRTRLKPPAWRVKTSPRKSFSGALLAQLKAASV